MRLAVDNLMVEAEIIMNGVHHLKSYLGRSNQAFTDEVSAGKDREKQALRKERMW